METGRGDRVNPSRYRSQCRFLSSPLAAEERHARARAALDGGSDAAARLGSTPGLTRYRSDNRV